MRAVVRGAGSVGMRHADVLRAVGADVSIWPVRPRTIPGNGPHQPGPHLYVDADLVVVATNTARHVADAVEALDHGARRVLIEKPVAPSAEDAAILTAHPQAAAVSVAAPLRAHEGFRALADAIGDLSGRLSAWIYCQSWLPSWRPASDYRASYSARAAEGGVLRDLVHEIDYGLLLFGPPRLAGAVLEHDGPLDIESEQGASLLWTTERATVVARLDYTSRPGSRGAAVRSSAGAVAWDATNATVTITSASGDVQRKVFPSDLDRNIVMATQARGLLTRDRLDTVDAATRLAQGLPATLIEAIAAIQLCDDARQADSTRRRQELDERG